jgi:hypothetical protein
MRPFWGILVFAGSAGAALGNVTVRLSYCSSVAFRSRLELSMK